MTILVALFASAVAVSAVFVQRPLAQVDRIACVLFSWGEIDLVKACAFSSLVQLVGMSRTSAIISHFIFLTELSC